MWCDVMWCDVMWCDVMWCDVMWCDVRWCDVMWCDVMWCDVRWWSNIQCHVMSIHHITCQQHQLHQYLSLIKQLQVRTCVDLLEHAWRHRECCYWNFSVLSIQQVFHLCLPYCNSHLFQKRKQFINENENEIKLIWKFLYQ